MSDQDKVSRIRSRPGAVRHGTWYLRYYAVPTRHDERKKGANLENFDEKILEKKTVADKRRVATRRGERW